MRGSVARITLLVFQVVWLNAILPGHTRGIIQMSCDTPQGGQRCVMSGGSTCPKKSPQEKPAPPSSSNCAVCQYAARMTPPPVIDYRPAPLELTELIREISGLGVESADLTRTYYGRAPPLA